MQDMELYEISKVQITAGVYHNIGLGSGVTPTSTFDDSFELPFRIGGRSCYRLYSTFEDNTWKLYAVFDSDSAEATVIYDGDWADSSYEYFYYSYDYTVSSSWSVLLNDDSVFNRYDNSQENLVIRSNNGNTLLINLPVGQSNIGVPKGVPINTTLTFTQAPNSDEVTVSLKLSCWYSPISGSYRTTYNVVGYAKEPNTLTPSYTMNTPHTFTHSWS